MRKRILDMTPEERNKLYKPHWQGDIPIGPPPPSCTKFLTEEEIIEAVEKLGISREECYCKECGKMILEQDTVFYYTRQGRLKCSNFYSFLRTAVYGEHVYRQCRCLDCVKKNFPIFKDRYQIKTTFALYTKYAFDVLDEDFQEYVNVRQANSEAKMIARYGEEEGKKRWEEYTRTIAMTEASQIVRYGEEEGKRRWEEYRRKQAETNSFEYKKEKYGMTYEEFKEYNKSRAVTKENLIKKHGEEEGIRMWEEYRRKQRYSVSLAYFVETYGEEEGRKKYAEFEKARFMFDGRSGIADEFTTILSSYFSDHILYYGETEKAVYLSNKDYAKVDYYDETLNVVVEFYGDYWHSDNYKEGKVEDDKRRINAIIDELGCKVIIVWEHSYRSNREDVLVDVINTINDIANADTITEF